MQSPGRLDVFFLRLQLLLDRIVFPFLGLCVLIYVRYIRRARFPRLDESRNEYRELLADKRPTLICSNHLTNFDTLFLNYGLGSLTGYMREFRIVPWNVPAAENFTASLFLRALTYFGKCIAVDRWGDTAHHDLVRSKLRWLMQRGEPVNMFIEGGRSRTGRVEPENAVYGPGRLFLEVPDARVLCVYMRGEKQDSHTTLPAANQSFYLAMDTIEPATDQQGIRGGREIARQIIQKLKDMEDEYFAGRS